MNHILQSRKFVFILCLVTILIVVISLLIPRKSKYDLEESKITGIVLSYKLEGDLLSFTLKGKEKVQVFYYIESEEEKNNLINTFGFGIKVTLKGEMNNPSSNTIPNTFNYKEYLYHKNIYYIFNANKIEINENAKGINWLKNKLRKRINEFQNKEYFESFLLGIDDNLDTTNIRKNGISHLFAISGMHISLFVFFLSKVFKKRKNIIISIFLIFYIFLIGFTPSIVRATLMYILLTINKKFHLNLTKPRILLYILCILLIINPNNIYDLGFQYSFLISFFIFHINPSKNYIIGILKTSFYCFIISLPITAMNFYSVNFLSILWNVIYIPFVSFIFFPLTIISFVILFIEPIYNILVLIFETFNNWCSVITIGVIIIPKLSIIYWIIYYLIFYIFYKRLWKLFLVILIFLSFGKLIPKLNNNAYVYFIDVGQGDSTLLISPYQKDIILIDTGGKYNFNKSEWQERKQYDFADTLKTFFNSLGINTINSLVITHGDMDHAGYALSLLNKINIKNIILNKNNLNELELNINNIYKNKIKENLTSSSFQINEFTINTTDENDASLIYKISIYNQSFLFMGDASSKVEYQLLNKNIQSDILKVGHHGSKTSSSYAFLKKVNPTTAIISVGENNRYGHPHQEVLNNLNKLNIDTYQTNLLGTIWFEIERNSIKINSMK